MAPAIRSALFAALCLWAMPVLADDRSYLPRTQSGLAYAEVTQSVRRGDVMTVTVRFSTDDPEYPGETLYSSIPENEVVRLVYLEAGDRNFELLRDGGEAAMPDALHLDPNPTGEPGAVVGTWEGIFEAPDSDLRQIMLILPNVDRIGPFPIRNR